MKAWVLFLITLLSAFKSYSQSSGLKVNIQSSEPSICAGYSIVLTANTTGGTGSYNYSWSTGEISSSITVNKAGTYTVSVTDKTPGSKPVLQSIVIANAVTPTAPRVNNQIICENSVATLVATAPGGIYQWYDQAVGGNFLGSGESYTTPPLNAAKTYYIQTTVNGCTSPRTPVTVYMAGKPQALNVITCQGSAATLTATNGSNYIWYDAAVGGKQLGTGSSFTTPILSKATTYYVEAVVNGCTSRIPVTVYVNAAPPAPKAADVTICSGSVASLHADVITGVVDWFDTPAGGTSLITSPEFTTPTLTSTTTYYVQATLNDCTSSRIPVRVIVNPIPEAPQPQTITQCAGTSATLIASQSPSGAYQWYDAPVGGHLLATGATYHTPVLNYTSTFYVLNANGNCASIRVPVKIVIAPRPDAPVATGAIICPGSAATLSAASATGTTIEWYDTATAGKLLSTGPAFNTPSLNSSVSYYVQAVSGDCASIRVAVPVTVLQAVKPPVIASDTVCFGNSTVLKATGTGTYYEWYDSPVGGQLLSSAQTFVTPSLFATTTFYVQTGNGSCQSGRSPVSVVVTPLPVMPDVSDITICSGTGAVLTASVSGNAGVAWYDSAIGGRLLGTGNHFTTPTLYANTIFYVESTAGSCSSPRRSVTVKVKAVPDIEFLYPAGNIYTNMPNVKPILRDAAGATFTSTPEGLVFANDTTGEINSKASKPGNYIVTLKSGEECVGSYSMGFSVAIPGHSPFGLYYGGPYCKSGINPLPSYISASFKCVYSAPPGLVFVDTTTGQIDLSASSAGTYLVTIIATRQGMPPLESKAMVTINDQIIVKAGPDQTVTTGSPVYLKGDIAGIIGGKWSGGAGSFNDPTLLNATYTPAPGEQKVVLRLTSNDPKNGCGAKADQLTVTFSDVLPAPIVGDISVCSGNISTVFATAPGGTYQWYDAPSGGNLIFTGANFIVPALNKTTCYYVQTTLNGVTSARSKVTINVNEAPGSPVISDAAIYSGQSATLVAKGSGTLLWYDSASGGNLLSDKSTFVTPSLTKNTVYYVQAINGTCSSPRVKVNVEIKSLVSIISAASAAICSGSILNYTIETNRSDTTISWSRAIVAGISNPEVTSQKSTVINETLVNTTNAPVDVTYLITFSNPSVSPFKYVVTVYPTPVYDGPVTDVICNKNRSDYQISFKAVRTNFSWSRSAVPGIANLPVTGQKAAAIREILYNTTNQPIDVIYQLAYGTSQCPGDVVPLKVTVNPSVLVTSAARGTACSSFPQAYTITSNIASASFSWKRAAVPGIANAAVSDQSSAVIDETLVNTGNTVVYVNYIITPKAYDCQGSPFTYTVAVNPQPATPAANSNSPVCLGSTINLRTPTVLNAKYLWTGPANFASTLQNPDISKVTAANSGEYKLYVTVNGCTSIAATTQVAVNQPPHADAGHDQYLCATVAAVNLDGKITGGTSTGVWKSSGTGTFSPADNQLDAQYIPSEEDRRTGAVTLTLASTSTDDCIISTSDVHIKFGLLTAAVAGANQDVCAQDKAVQLNGKILISGGCKWSSSGTGTFSPSANQADAVYLPGKEDAEKGSMILTLLATGADQCYMPSDSLKITFIASPLINAGGVRYVLRNNTITMRPITNDGALQYKWFPDIDISNVNIKDPVITGNIDRLYKVEVTNRYGCTARDSVFVKVSPELAIPNAFTPNNDGINDVWEIRGLIAYPDATVEVFNRYGLKVFSSAGYIVPWDGTFNGRPLPVGAYYYIINTKSKNDLLSGSVTILR